MSIGEKITGTLADAAMTSRNKANAWGGPDRGDAAHIPDDRTLRIEIGRNHKQIPTLRMFSSDCCKHVVIDIAGNELAKTRILKKARSKKRVDGIWRINKALSNGSSIDVAQRSVIGRAEKCKRRNQSASADSRNH